MRYCKVCATPIGDYDLRRKTCSKSCSQEAQRVGVKLSMRRLRAAKLAEMKHTNPPEVVAGYIADTYRPNTSVFPGVIAPPVKPIPKPVTVVATPNGPQTRCEHHIITKPVTSGNWELYCKHCGADQTDLVLMESAMSKAEDKQSPIGDATMERMRQLDFDSVL